MTNVRVFQLARDLGLDSLGRVELLGRMEKTFGVRLPESVLGTAETPRDLLQALLSAHPEGTALEILEPVSAGGAAVRRNSVTTRRATSGDIGAPPSAASRSASSRRLGGVFFKR